MQKVHYLLTRFNLNFSFWFDFDKNGKKVLTDEWLENRFELFDRYCFPSVKAQTNQNFIWLVLFDEATPEKYKERIADYKEYKNFCPLIINRDGYWIDVIRSKINSDNPSVEYVITTRLDNDDAIHCRMIEEVQLRFEKQMDVFLNFEYGLQYDVINKVLVKCMYKKNHFISRIEKNNKFVMTVISIDHSQIESAAKIINVVLKYPLWIELVHTSNVSNFIKISKPFFQKTIFNQFGFTSDIDLSLSIKSYCLKFMKVSIYVFFEKIATKLGLYDVYKNLIRLFKSND